MKNTLTERQRFPEPYGIGDPTQNAETARPCNSDGYMNCWAMVMIVAAAGYLHQLHEPQKKRSLSPITLYHGNPGDSGESLHDGA